MTVTGVYVKAQFTLMAQELENKDFSRMDSLHHVLAGFKSIYSEETLARMEAARRACGGAGYNAFSGFTNLLANTSPVPTYEGDNVMMLSQASRYLFKLVKRAQKNQKIPFPFSYINEIPQLLNLKARANSVDDFLDLDKLQEQLAVRAAYLISKTSAEVFKSTQPEVVKTNDLFGQAL